MELGRSDGLILIRDTQDRPGPVLAVPPAAWRAFTAKIR